MALIDWRQEFETGIAEVDYEHAALVVLINRIHANLSAGAGTTVADYLGELHDAIAAHFALEEKLMRARVYAGYIPHKEDHERLLDEIRDLMEAHSQAAAVTACADLSTRLDRWFSQHFQTMDAQLHRQIGDV